MMLQSRADRPEQGWKRDFPLQVGLGFFALLTYVPFVFTLVNSFKDNAQFFENLWLPAFPFHWENYATAWPRMSESIVNSFSYSIPTLLLVLSISCLTGYTFARFRFPGRNILFFAILVLIMLPGILLVIPKFSLIVSLNWTNTPQAVILPWVAGEIVFGTFLMRTFFETLPQEYFEAARLDGASEFTLILRIALPLALPALGTLAVLNLLFTWNDLIWPLVVILDDSRLPVSAGILAFGTQYSTNYGATFAAYVIASVPMIVIFAFFSRRFMQGLQGGLSI
jgi:ABC-type glycerol-3-phosphate transport system permease component